MENNKFVVSIPTSKVMENHLVPTQLDFEVRLEPTEKFLKVCENIKAKGISSKYATNGYSVFFVYDDAVSAILAYEIISNEYGIYAVSISTMRKEENQNGK